MLLAVGNIQTYPLLESMKLIANDQTQQHEWHQIYPQGTYTHHDGWGYAAYIKEKSKREPTEEEESTKSEDEGEWSHAKSIFPFPNDYALKNVPSSPSIILLHVRRKSQGEISTKNTHPFQINHQQQKIFFAHNGQIPHQITHNTQFIAQGTTDSEQLLYSICSEDDFDTNPQNAVTRILHQYPSSHGTNIILTTKKQSIIALAHSHYPKYYTMYLATNENQTIICSEQLHLLPNMIWQEITPGHICTLNHENHEISITPLETISPICQKI